MYKKSKTSQSTKLEKENENIELHKHIKSIPIGLSLYWLFIYTFFNIYVCITGKCSDYNKKETVWDRLSKVKRESSNTNVFGTSINIPSTQHVLTTYSDYRSSAYKHPNLLKKMRMPKRVITEKKNQTLVGSMPAKKIMIARNLGDNFKYSTQGELYYRNIEDVPKEFPPYQDQRVDQNSQDFNDEYKLTPLINSYASNNTKENFNDFLKNKGISMNVEDIEIVKDIIELDCRYENLWENPTQFKDILKTQLQTILKNESVVKRVLKSLDSSTSISDSLENKSAKQFFSFSDRNKINVEVTFKNVPTLEKEIEILRTLGEKLETTLRRNRLDKMLQRNVVLRPTKVLQFSTEKYRQVKYEIYALTTENMVMHSVEVFGLCHFVGIVEEFLISQKSIIELKQDLEHQFYIPSDSDSVRWIRTSFKNLKTTPDELMRHIKPKNSQIVFNVLEQDPIFFKNPFHKTLKLSNNHNIHNEKNKFPMKQLCCEWDDWYFRDISHDEKIQNLSNVVRKSRPFNNIGIKSLRSTSLFEATDRPNQRRCISRYLTPMPINKNCIQKNNLIKTILVGFFQILVFIMFIIALTFPDIKC